MEAVTIGTHNGGWAVLAQWYGQVRPVYGGAGTSIFACIAWRAANQKG